VCLGFDYSPKRIGVAIGNSLSRSARALEAIPGRDNGRVFARIQVLIATWQPQRLVVGRPSHPDGEALPNTVACERFARELETRFGLPTVQVDENYTTVVARGEVPGGDPDAEAAALILRQYLAQAV